MIGQEIRKARIRLGITNTELAKMTGLSRPAISLLEIDKIDLSPASIERVANAVQIDPASLLYRKGKVPSIVKEVLRSDERFFRTIYNLTLNRNAGLITDRHLNEVERLVPKC